MKTILHLDASARYKDSVSRDLSRKLVNHITTPEDNIITRDLNDEIHFISEDSLSAVSTQEHMRNTQQQILAKLADSLIAELQTADILVIGVPIYNFGPPASLKAWADLVARAGTTFTYTDNGPKGLLSEKSAYLITVSGGTEVNGKIDFMTPWLTFFLNFLGIHDTNIIAADGIFQQDGKQKIQDAENKIQALSV